MVAYRRLKTLLTRPRDLTRDYGQSQRKYGKNLNAVLQEKVQNNVQFFFSSAWLKGTARSRLESLFGCNIETFMQTCQVGVIKSVGRDSTTQA